MSDNRIQNIELANDGTELKIELGDRVVTITDNMWQCCEHRYMTIEDGESEYFLYSDFIEVNLSKSIVELDEPDKMGWVQAHDIAFVNIVTSIGVLVLSVHNSHNGYYAGFDIQVSIEKKGI